MTSSAQYTAYRLGSFTLDLERGALMAADGTEMPLRSKSFALLRLLVENAGRLLSRDTIMKALWPDVLVTDDNVTQCIHDIRVALGSEAQQMLHTRFRRGYLFTSNPITLPGAVASPHHNGNDIRGHNVFPRSVVAERSEGDEGIAEENAAETELSATPGTFIATRGAILEERRLGALPAERRQLTVMACDVTGLAVLSSQPRSRRPPGGDDRLSPMLHGYHRTPPWLRRQLLD